MKRTIIISAAILLLASCKEQCFTCQDVNGYPNATICQDTYETTMTELSPTWADYQAEALDAGCVKQ